MSSLYGEKLDPALQTNGAQHMYQVNTYLDTFIGRTKENPDTPWLLEKWVMAPDAMSWTLYARKGVKFHNGDAFTARDVKFTLDRYMDKSYAHAGTLIAFDRVEVVDDYTARLYC
ncbi:MAG: putative transporter substrate binding protein, partial [Dehalococcoidales bacterium]|nr:putative transporter substrate binding protein [Dehalococcoidales bacterium]